MLILGAEEAGTGGFKKELEHVGDFVIHRNIHIPIAEGPGVFRHRALPEGIPGRGFGIQGIDKPGAVAVEDGKRFLQHIA